MPTESPASKHLGGRRRQETGGEHPFEGCGEVARCDNGSEAIAMDFGIWRNNINNIMWIRVPLDKGKLDDFG